MAAQGWRRLPSLLWAAGLGWGAARAVAALLAACLAPISVDQPIDGQETADWGLRWGAVLAVAMASGAVLGPPPPAGLRRILAVVVFTAVLVLGLTLLVAALAILAVRLHLWGQAWELPSRAGYAARVAALAAVEILGPPCAAVGGWRLFRRRMGQARDQGDG